MISMRAALTDRLTQALTSLNVNVIQEDQLNESTPLPAVVVSFAGKRPFGRTEVITREGWPISILHYPGEYYEIGLIAKTLKDNLNKTYLNPPSGWENLGEAGMEIQWLLDGPTQLDTTYNMHTMVQYYEIIVQDY